MSQAGRRPGPTPAPTPAAAETGPALRLVLALSGLAALAALSTNIMLPALPAMAEHFTVSDAAMNGVLSVFLITFAVTHLLVGPLSDRIGRQPVILGGLGIFLAGTLLCATADRFDLLLAGRAVQATGAAAATVLARAAARDLFIGPPLARLLGLIIVVMAAAPGFSPLIGGLLIRALDWTSVFLMLALAGVLIGAGYLRWVGETLPPERRQRRPPGRIARDYGQLATDARFMAPASVVALIMGGLYAFFAASPVILMQRYGLDALQLGLFFAATVLVVFAAGTAAPRLSERHGSARVLAAGLALSLTGGLIACLAALPGTGLPVYTGAICVFLLGMGLVNPLGTAAALAPCANNAGQASSLLGFLQMAMAAGASSLAMALPLDRVLALGMVLVVSGLSGLLVVRATGRAG